jgi:3-hydroxyacyl-[acyl-carrier-protein] dehydratase
MRFHLVDRIDHVEPFRSVRARKLTSLAEEHWDTSSGTPVMPSALVLEALCQAGTWLVVISTERRKRAALLAIDELSFVDVVRPGDVVELEGFVDSMNDDTAVLSGRASVGGRQVLEARHIMCALLDASRLQEPEHTELMQAALLPVVP